MVIRRNRFRRYGGSGCSVSNLIGFEVAEISSPREKTIYDAFSSWFSPLERILVFVLLIVCNASSSPTLVMSSCNELIPQIKAMPKPLPWHRRLEKPGIANLPYDPILTNQGDCPLGFFLCIRAFRISRRASCHLYVSFGESGKARMMIFFLEAYSWIYSFKLSILGVPCSLFWQSRIILE